VLARWRVTDAIQKGGLNVRVAPSKTADVLLRLPKLAVLEASGPPEGDVTGRWLPIWNPEAPDTRAYAMMEDDARKEVCIEPLDNVQWWRVTERCNPGGLNLRAEPDMSSASLGRAARHTVLKAVAPPIIPAPKGSPYGSGPLQLRRWRVSTRVSPGCLNCRVSPAKDAQRLLRLPAGTIVEATGPPQREAEGEWLPVSLANVPGRLKKQGALPEQAWVIIKDYTHKIPELRTQTLMDPIDGDAPWLKVANPLSPGTSAFCLMHDAKVGVTLLEPLPDAAGGIGTVYECVTPTIVRAGLDALSTQIGQLEVGDEVVALETTVHSGRVRVKFSFSPAGGTRGGSPGAALTGSALKGWASVTSGSGGAILRAKPGRVGASGGGTELEKDGDGWADEQERTLQWLELKGASLPCAQRICKNFIDSGIEANRWIEQLSGMEATTLMMLIDESHQKLDEEARLARTMEQASDLMISGQYDGALGLYGQVLAEDPDHDEARRGVNEAEKGRRLASMTEEEIMAQVAAMQLHAELGMEQAEAPGSSKVRASHLRAGASLPTPSQPVAHREGHGPNFIRFCVRLAPDASTDAGEQGFDVQ
jgi:predicted transcriptional regulator